MFVQLTLQHLVHFLPETTLVVTFCLTIIGGLVFRKTPKVVAYLAFVGVAVALFFAINQAGTSEEIFSGMIAVDPFAVFFKSLAAICALIIFLFSSYSAEVQTAVKRMAEYYSLLVAMTLGMFLMAGATNVLMMVLAMELTSLSSYILAGYTKEASDSSEASLKYIIYGAVSSGVMLYGISILFGITGAMDYTGINRGASTKCTKLFSTAHSDSVYCCRIWLQDFCCAFPFLDTRCVRRCTDYHYCFSFRCIKSSGFCNDDAVL